MSRAQYSLFPIQYPELWHFCEIAKKSYWVPDEIPYEQDIQFLSKLTKDELHFIKHVLAFFAQSDSIVNENLAVRFYSDTKIEEARYFYTLQMAIESIHAETYARLIEAYVPNVEEKLKLFNAIENYPTIAKKAKWAQKWIHSNQNFVSRLIAFALVEGVFFSGSFCAVFWLKSRGLCPAFAMANKFISRDEGLHWTFAPALYRAEKLHISELEFKSILQEAVEIECEFITGALPVRLIGMNDEMMIQYIKYSADRVAQSFGFSPLYEVQQPFEFMNLIDLETKNNFFERKGDSYQKPTETSISFEAEF